MTACALIQACATPAPPRELEDVRAELRAMRAENQRLAQRLERLEQLKVVGSAAPAAAPEKKAAGQGTGSPMPVLAVVKLKPKAEAAPVIDTKTAVVEPSPEVVAEIKVSDADALDADVGEALFNHGVNALKTGNVEGGVVELLRFADESPKHAKADNALYFAGLGQMGLDDLDAATRSFESVIARYPAGDAVVDSMLKLAECRVRSHKPQEARRVYEKIVSSWPGTAAATLAQSKLITLPATP
ncbi:MAG: tetratricopeptide repeat protein [Myxococcaceae bacterium]|nr:tetratricopeptide repeat protein [Myxococcaceae bacterium]